MAVGFLFPGQGSQQVGMLQDFQSTSPIFNERIQEASAVLGEDLGVLINEGPAERLNQTEITQPALLCLSVALFEYWLSEGGSEPVAVAGHSLGEYSALTAVGVFNFSDAVKLVNERGKIMQSAVPVGTGGMAAVVGLAIKDIESACEAIDEVVAPANINTDTQVVIAGTTAGIEKATDALKEHGAKRVIPLAVSVPSHSVLMEPTMEGVAELLDSVTINTPKVPVYQNVDASPYQDIELIRKNLIAQLYSPVRWRDTFSNMVSAGCDIFFECGPGRVLSGIARQIDRSATTTSLGTLENFQSALG